MKRILYIEPDFILAKQLDSFFESKGYLVDSCSGAQQAIVAADTHTPDAVVMEIALAAHSGIEFLYEFRSYPEWRKVPVIILSRIPVEDTGLTGKVVSDLAITGVFYKPDVDLQKVYDRVEAALEEPQHG